MEREEATLDGLAKSWGIQRQYTDALGQRRCASDEAVIKTLRALGGLREDEDVEAAFERRQQSQGRRLCAPVLVAWDGQGSLPVHRGGVFELCLEGHGWRSEVALSGPGHFVAEGLPLGIFEATLSIGGASPAEQRLTVFSAPKRAFEDTSRRWGLFAPLYALHDAKGAADFGVLGRAAKKVQGLGGRTFGTLPLLAGFFEEQTFEASPYAPCSRRMWNELYVDLSAAPELAGSSQAQVLLGQGPQFGEYLDYRELYRHRSGVLEVLAEACSEERLGAFLKERPDVDRYARFRATRFGNHGALDTIPESGDSAWRKRRRFHSYAQLLCAEQLGKLSQETELYLDLPLGVHDLGWDAHEHREVFAKGVGAGAPPDGLFQAGQSWGFPPLLPEVSRETGHRYLRECFAEHMRYAGTLRIDHVAWLHRLFWVPQGHSAKDGLYVHNPCPPELYALLSILSHEHQCRLVGEDLGTVPDAVRHNMGEHGLRRTWVFQFEVRNQHPLWDAPPEQAAVTVNTHDTPTFAGWWGEGDIDDAVGLGLYSPEDEGQARQGRKRHREALSLAFGGGCEQVAGKVTRALAEGPGELLLLTLEDLWGESRPQNTPGTSHEKPNWKRRATEPLEVLDSDDVLTLLRDVDAGRKGSA